MEIVKRINPICPSTGRTHQVSVIYSKGNSHRKTISIKDSRSTDKILDIIFSMIHTHFGIGKSTHYLSVKDISTGKVRSITLRSVKNMTTCEVIELIKSNIELAQDAGK